MLKVSCSNLQLVVFNLQLITYTLFLMSTRKIATSTLWQLGSQGITMFLGFLGIKFVTTALSQSLVGNYQTVYAFLQIFGILADFGLYAIAVREYSQSKNQAETLGSLFLLRGCITIISLAAAVLLAWVIPSFQGTPLPLGITIAIFVPFFVLLSGMLRTVFQVSYKMHYVLIAEVIGKAIPIAIIGFIVFYGARESESLALYHFFLALGGLGSFIIFLLSFYFVRRLLPVRPTFSNPEFWRLAKLATPFGLAFLATTIYRQSDVTLIALLRPEDYDIQNAYYGVVLRLAEIGFLLPTFILNSALPMLSTGEKEGRDMSRFLGNILLGLLALGSIVSLFSYFWARPLMLLLTRESYLSTALTAGSDTALELLSFSMFLSMIITFCFYLLLSKHIWRPLLITTAVAAVFSVSLNLFMIPQFGFVGAGITSIATHLLLAISLVVISLKRIKVSLSLDKFVRWIAFSLIIAILLVLTSPILTNSYRTLLAGVIGVGVSGILLYALGLVPRAVLEGFRGGGD
jgi:O-antigen/teichoic acid export membrane protein